MRIKLPKTKAEAQALLARVGDYVDGSEDGKFDAEAVFKRAGAALVDDRVENAVIFLFGVALGVLLTKLF